MKKFFILMIVSCMLLVGCGSSTTTEKSITVPECDICHQSNTSYDWDLVSVTVYGSTIYCYKCRNCGNVIEVKKPIIRECFQK
jgi:major membrane immunogen (membrane-anchored lipoprotein)